MKLDLFRCLARDRKSPERGNVANVLVLSWSGHMFYGVSHAGVLRGARCGRDEKPQAAQAHYLWDPASEVIWSE